MLCYITCHVIYAFLPKTKLYIFMYKVDNNTYQTGWEKGRRWVKMKSVFTR